MCNNLWILWPLEVGRQLYHQTHLGRSMCDMLAKSPRQSTVAVKRCELNCRSCYRQSFPELNVWSDGAQWGRQKSKVQGNRGQDPPPICMAFAFSVPPWWYPSSTFHLENSSLASGSSYASSERLSSWLVLGLRLSLPSDQGPALFVFFLKRARL